MKRLFDCDTIWCCWQAIVHDAGVILWTLRWPLAVYALLYVVGAAIFLLTLKLKSKDGTLVVDRHSLAFAIAHPLIYGGHKSLKSYQGSICAFYARMFNMLLFVWPFLVLYFILLTTVGSLITLLFAGRVVWPNLHESGFMDYRDVTPFPTAFITVPLIVIALLIFKRAAVFRFLSAAFWIVLCILPVLIAVVVSSTVYWTREAIGETQTVSAVREVVAAHKYKFCKLIRFE